jgi:hypothetical protein
MNITWRNPIAYEEYFYKIGLSHSLEDNVSYETILNVLWQILRPSQFPKYFIENVIMDEHFKSVSFFFLAAGMQNKIIWIYLSNTWLVEYYQLTKVSVYM